MENDMRQRFFLSFVFLVIILLLSSCSQTMTLPNATPTPSLSAPAKLYLTQALDIMQHHSVMSKKVDWTHVRQEAFAEANHAQTPADTYPAIEYALQLLGDLHSFLHEPSSATQPGSEVPASSQKPFGQRLTNAIGYLSLPEFPPQYDGVGQEGKHYALLAQDAIRTIDQRNMCGWIVDVRNNLGGTMWPMLIGVGPILGESVVGAFVSADGSKQQWIYRNGQAFLDQHLQMTIGSAYQLKRPFPPVAILTNGSTASSGEAIAIAFRGRPYIRSFGLPTAGVPTANEGFLLSDGAVLELTTAFDADRTGRTYNSPIPPDQEVPSARVSPPLADDPVVQAARIWLSTQEGCQG